VNKNEEYRDDCEVEGALDEEWFDGLLSMKRILGLLWAKTRSTSRPQSPVNPLDSCDSDRRTGSSSQ
jgi:hypothetical protein